jgi:hypothetical protein
MTEPNTRQFELDVPARSMGLLSARMMRREREATVEEAEDKTDLNVPLPLLPPATDGLVPRCRQQ